MRTSRSIERDYRKLLGEVDHWFNRCLDAGGSKFSCRGGCSACCRGLFDITLLDAFLLKEAFSSLPQPIRETILEKSKTRLNELQRRWPELHPPYLLNDLPLDEWQRMPEDDETPCPLLDDKGFCLVYNSRPLTCRLHGLPNIDCSGEDFEGMICTLHKGSPLDLPEEILRWRFRDVFLEEIVIFNKFTEQLTGKAVSEMDTFIPLALLADYGKVEWGHLR
jgi:Fe-S-cluster containining protein